MSRRNRSSKKGQVVEEEEEEQLTSPKELLDACNEIRQFWLKIGSEQEETAKSDSPTNSIKKSSQMVEQRYKDILAVAKDCQEFIDQNSNSTAAKDLQKQLSDFAARNSDQNASSCCSMTEEPPVTYHCVIYECRSKLALLYLQRGNHQAASLLLERLGCRARLSDSILRYEVPVPGAPDTSVPAARNEEEGCCFVDNLIRDEETFRNIQSVFCPPAAPYWTQHGYCVDPPSPYFSYVVDLEKQSKAGATPSTTLSTLIDAALRAASLKYPKVLKEAKFCEIWAHNRPHFSGHQLHFDSDNEGRDGIRHPLATCVYVVSRSEDCGGPTLVTTQKLGDTKMASKGWLCFPKPNRVFMFESSFLHGVIPGSVDAMIEHHNDGDGKEEKKDDGVSQESNKNEGKGRRVTLMLAFWKEIEVRRNEKGAGAARPLPSSVEEIQDKSKQKEMSKWLGTLLSPVASSTDKKEYELRSPPPLSHVWVDVKKGQPWPKDAPIVSYEQAFQY